MVLYGPISLTSANRFVYLLLKFNQSSLLQDFCINFKFKSDMMVLLNGGAMPYTASSASFFNLIFKISIHIRKISPASWGPCFFDAS